MSDDAPGTPARKITIERTYEASIDVLWDLWTTKEGIESWWGPDGFSDCPISRPTQPDGNGTRHPSPWARAG